jgi:predicted transposase/invertase (TIGR01784 family)
MIGVDPKVDYAFKHLFGRDVTRPILIDVLNSILDWPTPHRPRARAAQPFNPKESLDDKLSILDIKARDQSGRQFNIEMQMLAFPSYEKRVLYYACKLHQLQLREGKDYFTLQPTISISFLNHVWFPEVPAHHLHFRLLEKSHYVVLSEDMEFHLLELPKFTKSAAELTSGLDVWLYFLRHAEMMDMETMPAALQQPLVMRALEELNMLTQTDLERERYEARRKAQLDENTLKRAAEMELEKVRMEIEKVRAQSLAEGRSVGEQIGIIHAFERVLGSPETPTAELAALNLVDLARLAIELQGLVLKQR